jgi:hypothetical protein
MKCKRDIGTAGESRFAVFAVKDEFAASARTICTRGRLVESAGCNVWLQTWPARAGGRSGNAIF